jgi:uncharacterized protein YecT (DUF1311 family)
MLFALLSSLAAAQETLDKNSINNPNCIRPPVGTYRGSCAAQVPQTIEKSPHELNKWITCLQIARGWGSGGSGDAYFVGELIPVWEEEMNEYILMLDKRLTPADRSLMSKEQINWEKARKETLEGTNSKPRRSGSLYQVYAVIGLLDIPYNRALDLGCRLERLDECNYGEGQSKMTSCGIEDFESSDRELNSVYKELMALTPESKRKSLLTEQRAWLKKRDPACKKKADDGAEGGTLWPMLFQNCRSVYTQARTDVLKLLKQRLD